MLFHYEKEVPGKDIVISSSRLVWLLGRWLEVSWPIALDGDGELQDAMIIHHRTCTDQNTRRSFFLQLPLIVLGAVNVYFVLDNPTADGSDWRHKLKRVDFSGALCIILAVSTLLIGLDQGSNKISWLSLITLSCLSSSLLFTITFLYIELYVTAEPLAPMHLLREMSLAACSLANFFAYACSTATVYYLPLYWQAAEGLSATQAALRLLPGNAAGVMGSLGAGVVCESTFSVNLSC